MRAENKDAKSKREQYSGEEGWLEEQRDRTRARKSLSDKISFL